MGQGPDAGGDRRGNLPPLSLHVPEPPFRPGDPVDYSFLDIPPAGAAPRPDETCDPQETAPLCTGMIRVLDDDHRAVGPWDPRLDSETLRRMLRVMALTRAFDDRMYRGQRQGKTSFYMKSLGEEAVSVGAATALAADDMCFPSYRQQGILIARGCPLVDMMNQIYSNTGDKLQGTVGDRGLRIHRQRCDDHVFETHRAGHDGRCGCWHRVSPLFVAYFVPQDALHFLESLRCFHVKGRPDKGMRRRRCRSTMPKLDRV